MRFPPTKAPLLRQCLRRPIVAPPPRGYHLPVHTALTTVIIITQTGIRAGQEEEEEAVGTTLRRRPMVTIVGTTLRGRPPLEPPPELPPPPHRGLQAPVDRTIDIQTAPRREVQHPGNPPRGNAAPTLLMRLLPLRRLLRRKRAAMIGAAQSIPVTI